MKEKNGRQVGVAGAWVNGEKLKYAGQELTLWEAQNCRPRTLSFILQTRTVQYRSQWPHVTTEFEMWVSLD